MYEQPGHEFRHDGSPAGSPAGNLAGAHAGDPGGSLDSIPDGSHDVTLSVAEAAMPGAGNPTAPDPGIPPRRFAGYRLIDFLGAGAMGEVYLYHDTVRDCPVAVKIAYDTGLSACRRFLHEARALAAIDHPNVVALHRVGRLAGRPCLVCEHASGPSLRALAPVPWPRALALGIDLACGLAAVHRRGILHRDIKAANAVLSATGAVKLIDFGLAAWMNAPARRSRGQVGTDGGAPLGTPSYMAPELWQGAAHDPRSDVYALGVLLYELCTGDRPPRASSPAAPPAPRLDQVLPGVDARFAAIVHRCLAPAPADRYASGEAVRQVLEILGGASLSSCSVSAGGFGRPRRPPGAACPGAATRRTGA